MSKEQSRDLVPAPAPAPVPPAEPQPLAAVFGGTDDGTVMSFDPRTTEGRQLLQKCEEEPDRPLKELANLKLRLRHVYARRITLERAETGELTDATRICLVTVDGKVHACVSEGVRQAVGRLIRGHGLPPWKAGVPVVVTLKTVGKGRQWLTLLEDFETPEAKEKR